LPGVGGDFEEDSLKNYQETVDSKRATGTLEPINLSYEKRRKFGMLTDSKSPPKKAFDPQARRLPSQGKKLTQI